MEIAEKKEKPFWETDQELHWGGIFSGMAADLMKLPVGTVFHVKNGFWDGVIDEKDGRKVVGVFPTDKYIPINETNRYGLVLDNVILPKENEGGKDDVAEQETQDHYIEEDLPIL